MAYVVDEDRCIGCRICEKVCPVNAIVMVDGKAKIDETLCTDCGICAERCPVDAISSEISKRKEIPTPPPNFYAERGFGMGRGRGGMGMRGQGGFGKGGGRGMGRGRGGMGRGPSGYCVCPVCGTRVPHTPGVPCASMKCPKCGANMVRE